MVYRVLYYLVNVLIRVFYRKLYINGLEYIDKDKTYLIVSNHPNGFFEPLIMACTFPIDLHFMVRGDLFENPFMNWFLRSTHQIPIFRFVDGFSKMKENKSSMGEAIDTLNKGNSILIFGEGSTKALMRLRPIQKGAAKMAHQTISKYPNKEIHILPVGINFNNWSDPGNEVVLNIGKPFLANPFFKNNEEHAARDIKSLTAAIENNMRPLIMDVKELENEDLMRKYWTLYNLKQKAFPRKTADPLMAENLVDYGNIINQNDEQIISKVNDLYREVKELNGNKRLLGIKKAWKSILWLLGIPGAIFHVLPVFVGYTLRRKLVKRPAFRAPILGISAFLISVLMYVIYLIIGFFTVGLGYSMLSLLLIVVSGFCFVLFWENQFKISTSKLPSDFYQKLEYIIGSIKK